MSPTLSRLICITFIFPLTTQRHSIFRPPVFIFYTFPSSLNYYILYTYITCRNVGEKGITSYVPQDSDSSELNLSHSQCGRERDIVENNNIVRLDHWDKLHVFHFEYHPISLWTERKREKVEKQKVVSHKCYDCSWSYSMCRKREGNRMHESSLTWCTIHDTRLRFLSIRDIEPNVIFIRIWPIGFYGWLHKVQLVSWSWRPTAKF